MNATSAIQAPAPRAIPIPRAPSHAALGRRRVLTRAVESARAPVLAAVRTLANGVDARTAAARTNGFYRASGCEWARSLG